MADWFVGPVMEKLIDACSDYLKDQVRWQKGMKEELQRLREIHPKIQSVVSAYSQAQIEDPSLNKWLWQLRDAVDEADDVLDDFEYKKHEKQVSKDKDKKIRKVRSLMKTLKKRFVKIGKRVFKIDPNLKRLEMAVQKLDKISAEVSTFLHLLDSTKQEQQHQQQFEMREVRETGSMINNDLLGRSKEMEFFRNWLRKPYQTQITDTDMYRNISLLSVVGHGGMGKTTLLQHVFDDGMTNEFDVKIWVCVSNNFNAKTVITNLLESLKKERPLLESLESLQRSLQSELMSKRFLLVLDDIWEEDERRWANVLVPLSHGSLGSKIMITTRMDSIASMFARMIKKSKETLQVKGLEEDECLRLFNTHAFASVENPDVHRRLKSIAREMVKKLSGCPLAAKVIGGILNFNLDESYWRKVLNTDIGNIEPGQNDLLPILKLSYIYLPKYLQNCFAFCCIFPEDHLFDKDDLVRMWIALGFIQSPNIQGDTFEDIGGRYFDILVRKSFFDKFCTDDDIVYYKMHDLLHELAQFVSNQECCRVMDDEELPISENIRHLSINTHSQEVLKKVGEFKYLRSLFLSCDEEYDETFVGILSEYFKALKNIRLLFISAPFLEKIPETIGCLIHLRYMRLDGRFFKLPRSISHLYHLRFIIYKQPMYLTCADDFSPRDINNLYNLRYLRLPLNEYCMIYEIGKLKSLQELNCFNVQNEIGYGIGELKNMNELRQISIYKLENINDVEEACSAKFYDKKNLAHLSLQWGDNKGRRKNIVDHDLDEKVLDSIQPHNNLKRLCINAYMGVRSAIWMSNVNLISNLEYVQLDECLKWQTLPPFGQLPFLKSLYLRNMPEAEQFDHNEDCTFPSLEVLHIENLDALQEWFDTTVAAQNRCLLPCLTELCLKNCPNLQELPYLSTKLQKLEMDNIGWKACTWLPDIRNCSDIYIQNSPNLIYVTGRQEIKTDENCQHIIDKLVTNDPSLLLMEPLRSISSLRFLGIEENDELVSFSIETEQWFLQLSSSLLDLSFYKLQSLQSLPSSLESLSSLHTLHVSNVPQLKLLPKLPASLATLKLNYLESLQCMSDLPSSLEQLELEKLNSLQCMSSSVSTLSSLNHIHLSCIPLLKSLPDLPYSLKKLKIEELESLQCLPSSLSTISSLTYLKLKNIPLLKALSDLPSSVEQLVLKELETLQCLPSSLSTISSLMDVKLKNIPLLKVLSDIPSSVEQLVLRDLRSLQCLPSSLSTISSLRHLELKNIPFLKELSDLPSSVEQLVLEELESLQCLPSSLQTVVSLKYLRLNNIPFLKSLPELPEFLLSLHLEELENLVCLPSCFPTLPSLHALTIIKAPRLLELPDLPASLKFLSIEDCHAQLMECYENFSSL